MKRRLIAVSVLASVSFLGVPAVAAAFTGVGEVGHVIDAKTAGPPYCC
jgi:hypothetical protein